MNLKQFLQVILPFLIVLGIIGFGAVALVSNEQIYLRQTGDIASIYLIFLLMAPAFLGIIITILVIFLINKGSVSLKNISPKIRHAVRRISETVANLSTKITKPIIEIDSYISIFSRNNARKGKDE